MSQRLELKSSNKHVALQNLSTYHTWKNIRKRYRNNELKIIGPTWNDEFELQESSYYVSDIQNYIEYTIKKHKTLKTIPHINVYINRINKWLVFKIKDGYKLELEMPETMKLFCSTKKLIEETRNGENVSNLTVVE